MSCDHPTRTEAAIQCAVDVVAGQGLVDAANAGHDNLLIGLDGHLHGLDTLVGEMCRNDAAGAERAIQRAVQVEALDREVALVSGRSAREHDLTVSLHREPRGIRRQQIRYKLPALA